MRETGKEILEFVDLELHKRGKTIGEMSRAFGINQARFSMWKQKTVSPTLETLLLIANYLDITLDELIGVEKDLPALPDDILSMEKMLIHIKPEDREMILLNIKNYYEREIRRSKG